MVQGYIKASGYIACAKEDIYVACWPVPAGRELQTQNKTYFIHLSSCKINCTVSVC